MEMMSLTIAVRDEIKLEERTVLLRTTEPLTASVGKACSLCYCTACAGFLPILALYRFQIRLMSLMWSVSASASACLEVWLDGQPFAHHRALHHAKGRAGSVNHQPDFY